MPDKLDRASDHLANERTFLAWTRTSISVIVFGFVVAKFGITLRKFMQLQNVNVKESGVSLGLGVAFMLVGVVMAIAATLRYRTTKRRLESGEFRPANTIVLVVGVITALLGVLLAGYLIFTSSSF